MIIRARAPLRVGLAGGGTDLEAYFSKHGGAVLNFAISRYAFTELSDSCSGYFEATAVDTGKTIKHDLSDLPSLVDCLLPLHLATYLFFIKEYNQGRPVPIVISTYCDAPVGSGLGSSSTLVVSMVKAWNEYFNAGLDEYATAEAAYLIERQWCGFAGGKQDQYSAAFGGINFIEFNSSGVIVHPLRIKNWFKCELESSLLLHYVGNSRQSSAIISDQQRLILSESEKLNQMHSLKECAYKMKKALLRNSMTEIKDYLNEGWNAKQRTSELISNSMIAERVSFARAHGAEACKISGAGGGGFLLILIHPARAVTMRNSLTDHYGHDTFFATISEQSSEAWKLKEV
jgi:D-glycero-alpha-D-manno-heptose-7-phosphate kinase